MHVRQLPIHSIACPCFRACSRSRFFWEGSCCYSLRAFLLRLWKNRESNLSKIVWTESCEWSCMSRSACGAVHARSSDECLEMEWPPVFLGECAQFVLQQQQRIDLWTCGSMACLISCARVCSVWVEMKAWHDRVCAGWWYFVLASVRRIRLTWKQASDCVYYLLGRDGVFECSSPAAWLSSPSAVVLA